MKQQILTVVSNKKLNASTFELVLSGADKMFSGQFVELKIGSNFLRRPFSVADYENGLTKILYKVVGVGTTELSGYVAGDKIDTLTQLGNTFNIQKSKKPVLLGGGIGVAPIFGLAKAFFSLGIKPTVVLGFRNADELFYIEEFKKIANVIVATDDGSFGTKGNAVEVLKGLNDYDYYYACGPMVMLKFLAKYSTCGEVSLEARMGCGFGACMGCSIMTKNGSKRVCKEGPVFEAEEVCFE